jgi:hypothetical protein
MIVPLRQKDGSVQLQVVEPTAGDDESLLVPSIVGSTLYHDMLTGAPSLLIL